MARRPQGLFATLREAYRAWRRSKYDDGREQGGAAATPDGTGPSPTAPRREVSVQSIPPDEPLALPARDDVFAFQAVPVLRWTSDTMSQDMLRTRAQQHEDAAREEVLRVAWRATRACDPADAVTAEAAVNEALPLHGNWCFEGAEGQIRCTPSVRLRVDPALREHVLPHHLDELTLKETQRIGLIRAERARTLTEAWLDVISRLELMGELDAHQRRLLVPFAATFADPEFRGVMEALRHQRRTSVDALVAALKGARGDHQEAGLFEFADAYDKALSAFCREMGVGPFSWVEGAIASDGADR
ncbi:hypothetical protein ABZX82_13465 [Streptomyces griseoflavus]|uniref:hypothetical protein n=1 Tax=Streptomyces griseoflavus TaxID=35619 RepID=UPI00167DCCBD|nr:hypothetical protein [Streptomyces griseoflavus]GGV33551.1 hypothetical protein GCM10010293_35400 [Streptomyces griseoflavus]